MKYTHMNIKRYHATYKQAKYKATSVISSVHTHGAACSCSRKSKEPVKFTGIRLTVQRLVKAFLGDRIKFNFRGYTV